MRRRSAEARSFPSRALAYLWSGPGDLTPQLKLEWRFVAVRWLGILFLAPTLLLVDLPVERLPVYGVLLVAAAYNLAVQGMLQRRLALPVIGYLTTVGDTLLNFAIVSAGGGFDTPFSYILFTITVGAAMRYGYVPAAGMALMLVAGNAFDNLSHGRPLDANFAFRSLFLFVTSVLASYLREQAHRAEAALQERLRQASLLNEATAMMAASLDFERVLRAVAAAAAHLFGAEQAVLQPSSEIAGDAHDTTGVFVHPEGAAGVDELLRLCAERAHRGALPQEPLDNVELPSGRTVSVLSLMLPSRETPVATVALPLPRGLRAPSLDQDILDSFVERTTLAVENAALYRTLARRSADLQRAFSDLANAHQELLGVDEMKTNFLANVSHELRTPLSSIRAFSELLLSYEEEGEVQKEFIQIINSESERLTRLVNDVLDISKIEAGQMDWCMTRLDLADLLQDTSRTYSTLIEQHNLAFEQDVEPGLPPVHGDRDRLQQVIGNLLNNSVKFTSSGFIRLTAGRLGDEVRISVADSGMGISPDDQERIFEKFQQVGAVLTDKPRGTGLGLAICRDIVRHHSGRIWVDSQPGVGSTFTVALPVLVEPADGPAEAVGVGAVERP
ncbi:MAG TPA: HAMP domain-containing sensor histidine kinase [Chloroflexota bacterium]|jgi:signal transduction histidine kinase|nr:HAMP domain-containing sensor histidine kinase [Chloroflexota bacterium]